MPRSSLAQPARILDAYEVEVVEKSVFGMTAAEEDRLRSEESAERDGFAVPEADRLFEPPTPELAARALRDLGWEERLVCTRMASARGNTETYLYSLSEAAVFLLDASSSSLSLASSSSFVWVDVERLVRWVRTTVGDVAFANVLEERLAQREAYNDKLEVLRRVMGLRMAQYARYLPKDEDLPKTDEENDGSKAETASNATRSRRTDSEEHVR